MVWGNSYKDQPGKINPARLKESYIGVFSSSRGAKPRTPRSKAEYDFATVDVRELCHHSRPEKANPERVCFKRTSPLKICVQKFFLRTTECRIAKKNSVEKSLKIVIYLKSCLSHACRQRLFTPQKFSSRLTPPPIPDTLRHRSKRIKRRYPL